MKSRIAALIAWALFFVCASTANAGNYVSGVQVLPPTPHQFVMSLNSAGVMATGQPSISDLSDAANVGKLNAIQTWSALNTFSTNPTFSACTGVVTGNGASPVTCGAFSSTSVQYNAGGTNPATQTVQDWMRRTVLATDDSGVDPTGTTNSDVGINRLLSAGNVHLYLPCGTYKLGAAVLITSGSILEGFGPCSKLYAAGGFVGTNQTFYGGTTGAKAVVINSNWAGGNNNFAVRHLAIDTTDAGNSVGAVSGVLIISGSYFSVEDTSFASGARGGEFFMTAGQSNHFSVGRNRAQQGTAVEGIIDVWDGGTDFDISDNDLDGGSATLRGITINGISSVRGAPGIGRTSQRFTVQRNKIANTYNLGIQLLGLREAPGTFTASITGTTMTVTVGPTLNGGPLYLSAGEAITGAGVTAGTTIVSQINGTPGGVGDYQVSISQTVASETMTGTTGTYGVDAHGVVSGNVISGLSGGASKLGIYIGDATDLRIAENTISDTAGQCLYFSNDTTSATSTYLQADNNSCIDTGTGGVEAVTINTGMDHTRVAGGTIKGSAYTYPVRAYAGATNVFLSKGDWAPGVSGSTLSAVALSYNAPSQFARTGSGFAKTSDTALADVTGLSFNVEKGRAYRLTGSLIETQTATGGQKYSLGGTATFTTIGVRVNIFCDTTSATRLFTGGSIAALGGTVAEVGTACAVANVTMDGVLLAATSGTLTIQFAQQTSDPGASTIAANASFQLNEAP